MNRHNNPKSVDESFDMPFGYKAFYGNIQRQMPKLIKEGRKPISVAELMQLRIDDALDALNHSEDPTTFSSCWWSNDVSTGDAIFYHPSGLVKVALDSDIIKNLNPEIKVWHGSLIISEDEYYGMPGTEFTKEQQLEYSMRIIYKKEEATNNPFWQVLARNQKLLETYADTAFNISLARRDSNAAAMNIDLHHITQSSKQKKRFFGDLLSFRAEEVAWNVRSYLSTNLVSYLSLDRENGIIWGCPV